jgi:hypothetical protein
VSKNSEAVQRNYAPLLPLLTCSLSAFASLDITILLDLQAVREAIHSPE